MGAGASAVQHWADEVGQRPDAEPVLVQRGVPPAQARLIVQRIERLHAEGRGIDNDELMQLASEFDPATIDRVTQLVKADDHARDATRRAHGAASAAHQGDERGCPPRYVCVWFAESWSCTSCVCMRVCTTQWMAPESLTRITNATPEI